MGELGELGGRNRTADALSCDGAEDAFQHCKSNRESKLSATKSIQLREHPSTDIMAPLEADTC